MLTQMKVYTPSVTTSPLPAGSGDEASDPIQILDITGLEPVTTVVNTTQYGSLDGEFYNGSTTGNRNIVLTLGLNADWAAYTPEQLRLILYQYFSPQQQVRLRFISTHMESCEIVGYVESCEPALFAKDSVMVVSIICPQPYFTAVRAKSIQGSTAAIGALSYVEIDYAGVSTGFVLDISDGGVDLSGEIRLITNNPFTKLFTVVGNVDSTHSVEISTVQGDKYASQITLPAETSDDILGDVSPGSVWIPLMPGVNQIQVQTDDPGQNWILRYYARYGGL